MILYEHQQREDRGGNDAADESSLVIVAASSSSPLLLQAAATNNNKNLTTSHQKATVLVLQENMRYQYDAEKRLYEDVGGSNNNNNNKLCTNIGREASLLIDDIFPELWSQLQILDLAGVYPALGPTGLIYMENGDKTEYSWNPSCGLDQDTYIQMRKVEAAHDQMAMKGLMRRLLEPHGVALHVPDVSNPNLEKWCYEVRTLGVESLDRMPRSIDKYVLNTMHYSAQDGTWDNFGRKPGSYVICAEEDAWKVQQRTGKPVVMPGMTPGTAYIGFKASESHASFYFMPYVPIHMYRAIQESTGKPVIRYKTRFGMLSSNPEQWYSADRAPRKCEFWKVKV